MLIDLLNKAKQDKFAIGAFNVGGLESLRAIAGAAKKLNSPVFVEVSPGEEKYLGLQNFVSLVNNLKEEYGIQMFLNLDHGEDINIITNAIELGFDLVHFDGSKLPLEENIRLCQEVVTMAHSKGVLVEGEMDQIGKKLPIRNWQKSLLKKPAWIFLPFPLVTNMAWGMTKNWI